MKSEPYTCKHAYAARDALRSLSSHSPENTATHNERVLARALLHLIEDIYLHLGEIAGHALHKDT